MAAAKEGDLLRTEAHKVKSSMAGQESNRRSTALGKDKTIESTAKRKETMTKAKKPCKKEERVPMGAREFLHEQVDALVTVRKASKSEKATQEVRKLANHICETAKGAEIAMKRQPSAVKRGAEGTREMSVARKKAKLKDAGQKEPKTIKRERRIPESEKSQYGESKNGSSRHEELEVQDDGIFLDNMEDSEDSDVESGMIENTETHWRYPAWRNIKESENLLFKPLRKGSTSLMNGEMYTHETEENPLLLSDSPMSKPEIQQTHAQVSLQSKLPELVEPRTCRAWHAGHRSRCVDCRLWFKTLKDPLELSVNVPIGDEQVPVRLSIPTGGAYTDVSRQLKFNGLPTKRGELYNRHRPGVKYWIFHPSHREPHNCLLNYRHVLGQEQTSCIQAVVVQKERFHSYKEQWGKSHIIIQLPTCSHDVVEGKCPVRCPDWASEGGIGYARRFIQLFAFALKMEYVFILDDNILFMAEAQFPCPSLGPVRKEETGALVMKRCPFTRPFTFMKELVEGHAAPPVNDFEPYPFEYITKSSQSKRHPMYSYTGPAKDMDSAPDKGYAMLGMLGRYPKVKYPFSRTHVSGAVLLNVKATVENDVFYRPWPCWEGVRFSDDCDLNRLWVVRFNRFLFGKAQYRDCLEIEETSVIYEWNERTELERSGLREKYSCEEAEMTTLLGFVDEHIEDDPKTCRRLRLHSPSQKGNTSEHNLLNNVYEKIKLADCTEHNWRDIHNVSSVCLTYSPKHATPESWEKLATVTRGVRKRVLCFMSSADACNVGWTSLHAIQDNLCACDTIRLRKAQIGVYSAADPSIVKPHLILVEVKFENDPLALQQNAITQTQANVKDDRTRPTAFEYLQNLLAT